MPEFKQFSLLNDYCCDSVVYVASSPLAWRHFLLLLRRFQVTTRTIVVI